MSHPALLSVHHVTDLPDSGGCLPAHQLLQLQLLVLHGFVCCRADLPPLEAAGQTQTSEGKIWNTVLVAELINFRSTGYMKQWKWLSIHTHASAFRL